VSREIADPADVCRPWYDQVPDIEEGFPHVVLAREYRLHPIFHETQLRLLTVLFERGAETASQALSQWLGRHLRVTISGVDDVEMSEATELLGSGEELVAACLFQIEGALTGTILMVFEDRSGLALTDLLLRQAPGTAASWGELEQSAAKETANIVVCAYLNSLAAHLAVAPSRDERGGSSGTLVPSPPEFRHEFSASLLQFTLMDQATESDRLLIVRSQFVLEGEELRWWLVFVPSTESLRYLSSSLSPNRTA
jgi:chemotaxis protein CheC